MEKIRVIIIGAAGTDFHYFNVVFRNDEKYEVVAFTQTGGQNIGEIGGKSIERLYPKELSGKLYPKGIPIYPEDLLPELIKRFDVDQVVQAYHDISYDTVMHNSAIAMSNGADFRLIGPKHSMLESEKPVVAVCAVRTGCGKSQTSRRVSKILKNMGKKVVVVRHPMPYGDLKRQICQRFASYEDLKKHECTIEEREEYEPHLENGFVVYAGIDYEKILREAEKEADVILWDGGNNDLPFYKPDLHIVVTDPHRPDHELKYFPGEVNARMADVIVINKINTADVENVKIVKRNIKRLNPNATIVEANSVITVDDPDIIKKKSVLVIEDGPTLTHGGMSYGAGIVAAKEYGCEIIDPRPYAIGSIRTTFKKYKHLGNLLPAMGYSKQQIKELEDTINACDCDVVLVGTPIDLRRFLKINKPTVRVRYELEEISRTNLEEILKEKFG